MNKQLLVLSFDIGIAIFALKPAQAQTAPCATHEAIVAHLTSEFGETRQSIGLAADNSVVEVFCVRKDRFVDHYDDNRWRSDLPCRRWAGVSKRAKRAAEFRP